MAGIYTAQMVAMRFGVSDDNARRALWANGLQLNLQDQVDAEAIEHNADKLSKWLDEDAKAQAYAKSVHLTGADEKVAAQDKHNKKVEADLAKHGSWENAALAAMSGSSKSEEGE